MFPTDQEAMCGAPLPVGGGWETWSPDGGKGVSRLLIRVIEQSRKKYISKWTGPLPDLPDLQSCRADSANLRANPLSVRVQCISDTQVYPISGGVPAHHWHVCALVSVHV